MQKKQQINLWHVGAARILVFMFHSWWEVNRQVQTIPYSQLETLYPASHDSAHAARMLNTLIPVKTDRVANC